jgi:hypothetical protein
MALEAEGQQQDMTGQQGQPQNQPEAQSVGKSSWLRSRECIH